jgi:hypothetical protein
MQVSREVHDDHDVEHYNISVERLQVLKNMDRNWHVDVVVHPGLHPGGGEVHWKSIP